MKPWLFIVMLSSLKLYLCSRSDPFKPPINHEKDGGIVITHASNGNISLPDYNLYHKSDEILSEVRSMAERHPDKLTLSVETLEKNGYSTEFHHITVTAGGPKYVLNSSLTDHRLRVLLDFGQHGREPITSEVALSLLKVLVGEEEGLGFSLDGFDLDSIRQLLPHMVIKIVPLENINGLRKVEAGQLCERKNGRGVDTNRNWAVDWGKKEKDYDPREEYPGSGPFSEPEAELLRRLAEGFNPHMWINVHSGMEALFMPYDHVRKIPGDGSGKVMWSMLQSLNAMHLDKRCAVGSGGTAVGYLAHGTATDWMFDKLHVPLAFTFEIYGDISAPEDDCFRMFNPITKDSFEKVLSSWTKTFISLLLKLPDTLQKIPYRILPQHEWSIAPEPFPAPLFTSGHDFRQEGMEEDAQFLVLEAMAAFLLCCILALGWAARQRLQLIWFRKPKKSLALEGRRLALL